MYIILYACVCVCARILIWSVRMCVSGFVWRRFCSLLQCMMDSAAVFLLCLVCVSFVQTSRHLLHPEIETFSLSFSPWCFEGAHTQRHSFRRHQSGSSQLSACAAGWLISQAMQDSFFSLLIHTVAHQLLAKGLWIVYAHAALASCVHSLQKLSGNFLHKRAQVQQWLGGNLHKGLKIYSMSKRISWGETT